MTTSNLWLDKFRALAAHIGFSLVLVGAAVALMWFRWFPEPLFHTDGAGIGLKLIVLVDLVLGPLLTFIVFDRRKSRRALLIDFTVIFGLQLGGYVYGMHNIYVVRVQAVAYHEGVFHTVTTEPFAEQEIAHDGWDRLGAHPPYLVDTREPASEPEATGAATYLLVAGLEPFQLQFLYRPFAGAVRERWAQGWTLDALQRRHAAVATAAVDWLQGRGLDEATLRFYPVDGFFESAVMVIDAEGRWLGGFAATLPAYRP